MLDEIGFRQLLPVVAGALFPPTMAAFGWLLFDDPVFGAAVGVALGVSIYMLLSYMFAQELLAEGKTPEGLLAPPPGYNRGAAAMALVPVGVVPLVWRAVSDTPEPGILAGMLAGAAVYVAGSRVLPNAGEAAD